MDRIVQCLLLGALVAGQSACFDPIISSVAPDNPYATTIDDFNQDSFLDLATIERDISDNQSRWIARVLIQRP